MVYHRFAYSWLCMRMTYIFARDVGIALARLCDGRLRAGLCALYFLPSLPVLFSVDAFASTDFPVATFVATVLARLTVSGWTPRGGLQHRPDCFPNLAPILGFIRTKPTQMNEQV